MRILLTGFEPFGSSTVNPSAEVVAAFAANQSLVPLGVDLTTIILPVEHQRGPALLLENIQNLKPAAIISLGEARGRSAISIEQLAVNWVDYRMPDNAGVTIDDQPVTSHAPAAYFSTLPIRAIAKTVRTLGIAAEISRAAGVCLCNEVMYTGLHHLAQTNQPSCAAGFIHLPWLPAQVARQQENIRPVPSMHLDDMIRAIRAALEVTRDQHPPLQA